MPPSPSARRTELAAFLRSRRARLTPADVGVAPGFRRRTPGLRREEVAQLAGVGVTWYTWLEQGRPINASVQVLDAVARVLQLDVPEREHLYRLAGIPFVREPASDEQVVGAELLRVLETLDPLPAAVYNARYDVVASNSTYRALWPMTSVVERDERNVLYKLFTVPQCCSTFVNRDEELPWMVAQLRRTYGRHVGEPAWESFIARLTGESPWFARLWASGDVAAPGRRVKVFRHSVIGIVNLTSISLSIDGMTEHRIVTYTPVAEEDRLQIERMRAMQDPIIGCTLHGRPLSAMIAERAERAHPKIPLPR
ncbi:Transcriptional regulator, contains XRE-family HTH domain [Streptomyces sp. DvalAA-14]|uniref:helix-turn-helix transcriptional regulator n=1 Tax=unclassified Streptomyces TaxID=2593676 RepID=UPI00081B4875|nr:MULTISPECIES: helix-turn-helix transcriptional regulator [unclassified Streptomyces]MYS25049.1 helix-turn-helix domain-containing protein [Streptomyces sp. SID4948]SCE51643.1 Transcriptional regulator, contains XRE-family HTH domain [Streptomyces sp. DvalAA-14]